MTNMNTMSVRNAEAIIRACAAQDLDSGEIDTTKSSHDLVLGWREAAAAAGDSPTVRAIDALGIERAAEIYAIAILGSR